MQNIFKKYEVDSDVINDWFDALDEADNHNQFTYSVQYYWQKRKAISFNQIKGLLPFAWSAYKLLAREEDWNDAWDNLKGENR